MSQSDAVVLKVANPRRFGLGGVIVRALGVCILATGVVLGASGFLVYAHFAKDLPSITDLKRRVGKGVTRFTTADGQLAGEWGSERRYHLAWKDIPQRVILAFLAAEDARFFSHHGVDLRGIARATYKNIRAGGIRSGASTITQQLAKTIVGSKKSLTRKIREAILARRMEDVFSKTQILTRYLNSIYLGYHSYGVQAAARNYFRKDISELTLAETAMLAGLPVAPSRRNPVVNMPAALKRMDYVLGQMERWGWVSPDEAADARATGVEVKSRTDTLGDSVPYYTEAVRKHIAERYGHPDQPDAWLERGLSVQMHVEPAFQHVGRRALQSGLEKLARKQGYAGALGTMKRKAFLKANTKWLGDSPPEPGKRLLARVSAVTAGQASVELGEGLQGTILKKDTRWAGPYREYERTASGTYKKRKVSFRPRLRNMKKAFKKGDVILVEVTGGPPGKLNLKLVPIPLMEGALVSSGVTDGMIDAAVGGWDFDRSQVNRIKSVRQTGSIMKPIIYAKAYDLGLPPSAIFSGVAFREGNWNPTGKKSKDDKIVWNGLASSDNAVSLRVLKYVLHRTDLADYEAWGRKLGLPRPLKGNTAEALGGDQTPLGMTEAFSTFARRGLRITPHLIRKVVDHDGQILEENISPIDPHISGPDIFRSLWASKLRPPQQVVDRSTAYLINANMKEVITRGTGKRAKRLSREAAGKTGTLPFDVWFVGFTRSHVALAWIGADRRERPLGKSEKVNKVYGSDTALPVWLKYMRAIDKSRPTRPLLGKTPEDVEHYRIDPANGLLLEKTGGLVIPHRKGTEPNAFSFTEKSPENIDSIEGDF